MRINLGEKTYQTVYFPFFRIKEHAHYTIYGIRYPSGNIERLFVDSRSDRIECFREYLKYLIQDFMMEDDDVLTEHGRKIKEDVYELFGERKA